MIKAAFITPHSPILIPAIGKANSLILAKTASAFKEIEQRLIEKEIDTIVIISSHAATPEKCFAANVAPELELKFENFGDYSTKSKLAGDMELATLLSENISTDNAPLRLTTEISLDHGSAIPLYLSTSAKPDIKIVPLSCSELNRQAHLDFGRTLQKTLLESQKKIALIASGELSHRLKKSAPAGYSPKGAKFDNKVIEYASDPEKGGEKLVNLDDTLIKDVSECGLRAIIVLLGILQGLPYESHTLCYQNDFGVGHLTMEMEMLDNKRIKDALLA